MIGQPLAAILKSERDALNARYAAALKRNAQLNPDVLFWFLENCVDPLATKIWNVKPDMARHTVLCAYDVGLIMAGGTSEGRMQWLQAIQTALCSFSGVYTAQIAADPWRVLSALSNALYQLVSTPGCEPRVWIEGVAALAPHGLDTDAFLRIGQVMAWRAGLAHYRETALAIADTLAEPLAVAAFGASGAWGSLRESLLANPWFVPNGGSIPRFRTAGAFRGYGGLFPVPPTIGWHNDHFVVHSRDEAWILIADAFGATFHRATNVQSALSPGRELPDGVSIKRNELVFRGQTLVPMVGTVTSCAANEFTLAITTDATHAVLLVALPVAA